MGKIRLFKTERMRKIKLAGSSNMTAAVFLVLALAVIITLLSNRHYLRWDMTFTGEHSLSEKTLQVLKTIDAPVTIKAFVQEELQGADQVKRLLGAYTYAAPKITYEIIDPERNPGMAVRYNVKSSNTLVLEGYKQIQVVKLADEENITNGLIRLVKSIPEKVYWITGHGEKAFKGGEPESLTALQESFAAQNYEFQDLFLMQKEIPEEASLVVVAAPEKRFFPEEVEALKKYLDKGGSLLIFLEPFVDGGLKEFLNSYGIETSGDIVVDKMSRVMGGDYLIPMVANYGAHEITKDFRLTSFFPLARSIEVGSEKKKGITVTGLAFTSPESWAETDRIALDQGRVAYDGRDRLGPLSLAVVAELEPPVEKPSDGKESQKDDLSSHKITGRGKMVVFGDVHFATNKYISVSGNNDFIVNSINFLVGRGDLITITKKPKPTDTLMLSKNQGLMLFMVPVVFVPLFVLLLGIAVWHKRRSR
jgi:gliding motility-associatede transport system auxiliary component